MSNWVGYAVSVNCGEPLGCYQGTILEADGSTITLTKAFRNGFPYPKSQVTLNAADIKDLRIIEEAHPEGAEKTHSTVAVTKSNKKAQRATVCENLQATNTGNQQINNNGSNNVKPATARSNGPAPVRSKPIDIQPTRNNKNNTHSGSFGGLGSGSTPKARSAGAAGGGAGGAAAAGGARGELARRRNEACFGDAADPALLDDFDFEGNLALFDKQALWEEMRATAAAAAARPDVVRAADEAARSFRHDENVLGAAHAQPDGIWVPEELSAGVTLRTDDGRRVPAVTEAARRLIWNGIMQSGEAVSSGAWLLLARAAADVALRLVGGGRRLEARNAHQPPALLVVAAPHAAGAAALAAARLLASHTPTVHVLLAGSNAEVGGCAATQRELAALARHGVRVTRRPGLLPAAAAAPDLLLLALHDPTSHLTEHQECEKYAETVEWVRGARCGVLVLEGGAGGAGGAGGGESLVEAVGAVRGTVVGALPPPPPRAGQLFLANVAPPPSVFRALGVAYRPPFGAATLLPLY